MIKKITAKKDEGLAEVIDRILDEQSKEVLLVVPKGSPLGKSPRNFNILKNEMEAAGKTLYIDSPDEEIADLARTAGIEGEPKEKESKGHRVAGVMDIVPARSHRVKDEVDEEPAKKTIKLNIEDKPAEEKMAEETEQEEKSFFAGADRFFKPRKMEEIEREEGADGGLDGTGRSRRRHGVRRLAILAGIIIVVVVIFYGVTALFGHADITINFKKTPWQYQGSFTADKAASSITTANSGASGVIPAQLFTIPKNTTQLFPASGQQNVSLKAQGTLIIYNAYSSAAQQLVATTRFVTPDGKIFRLASAVTVPGAQVTNGAIVPSSINATVVADKAGPDYNVAAAATGASPAKLTVPGFQGTAKYDGFYGTLTAGTSGGFIGQKAVPTAADITAAKAAMTATLQGGLNSAFVNTYPSNFKILPGATSTAITKLTVSTTTDANGNFSVFGEATLQAIGFNEASFTEYLLAIAQATEPSSTWSRTDNGGAPILNYTNVKPDFVKGIVSFSLAASDNLEPALSVDDFKTSIEGGSVNDARTTVAALPQLQDGSISVWPAWMWNIPGDGTKINIMVN